MRIYGRHLEHFKSAMSGKIKSQVAVNEREDPGSRNGTVIPGDGMTLSLYDKIVPYRVSSEEDLLKLTKCCALCRSFLVYFFRIKGKRVYPLRSFYIFHINLFVLIYKEMFFRIYCTDDT